MSRTHDFNLNAITLMTSELERVVKDEIREFLVKKFLADFEVELRDHLNKHIDHLTIGKVERMADIMSMRDELHVFVHHTQKENQNDF